MSTKRKHFSISFKEGYEELGLIPGPMTPVYEDDRFAPSSFNMDRDEFLYIAKESFTFYQKILDKLPDGVQDRHVDMIEEGIGHDLIAMLLKIAYANGFDQYLEIHE